MDKRIDQLTYMAPTGTRLLVHADPNTGSMRKAPVSEFTGEGGGNNIVALQSSQVNSVASVHTQVVSYAIPANTLDSNGKGFRFYIMCNASGSSSNRQISVQFQGSSVVLCSSPFAFYMLAEGTFLRRSSSTGIITGFGLVGGSSPSPTYVLINSIDFTSTTNIILNIYSNNNDELISETAYIEKLNF